eukprot:CAMPEP_0117673166 /NCGR_PEP_ID=MMETSP0804-20121206/14323_1 /TAXON_ID=1074897 /ORGANISM="Tetraselmis astigmatica, Strain CCMP880" /LENGTH=211 /DNA_ID=CAMNT_0005481877 /DNA_START=61 /DNA_END=696 /DNA_ORIENTATION=-
MYGSTALKQAGLSSFLAARRSTATARRGNASPLRCAAEATPTSKVNFRVTTHVEFGQRVEVTGETEALGGWQDSKPLSWTEGDVWTLDCDVPPGPVEYKYVIKTVDGALLGWQPGSNRHIEVPEGTTITVSDGWESEVPSVTPASSEDGTPESAIPEEAVPVAANGTVVAHAVDITDSNDMADFIEEVIEVAEDIAVEIIEESQEIEAKHE